MKIHCLHTFSLFSCDSQIWLDEPCCSVTNAPIRFSSNQSTFRLINYITFITNVFIHLKYVFIAQSFIIELLSIVLEN